MISWRRSKRLGNMQKPNKPYYEMSFGKWALTAMFSGTVLFLVIWSLDYRAGHPLGIFTAKHPMTLPQEVEMMTPDHQGHSNRQLVMVPTTAGLDRVVTDPEFAQFLKPAKCKTVYLPNRNMTADVGQYRTMDDAKSDLQKLRAYLNSCTEDFCKGLADKASVQEVNWPGDPEHITYFLVIKGIDDPTFYALCDYMWNTEDAWARETYHRCTDFDHRDDP